MLFFTMKTTFFTLPLGLLLAGLSQGQSEAPPATAAQVRPVAAQEANRGLLPPLELVDFQQTSASSLDSLFGQTILLEFFAYW
jgi:hypothetical protein